MNTCGINLLEKFFVSRGDKGMSAPAIRLTQAESRASQMAVEGAERIRKTIETHYHYVVNSDVVYFWLPQICIAQRPDNESVVISNRGLAGWSAKNTDFAYLKVLQCHLGEGYGVRVKFTRWLLRPYIEVSYHACGRG